MVQDIENRNHYKINLAIDFIHNNLEKHITLEDLSRVSMISSFHFHRLFTIYTGDTPMNYINKQRIKRALYLIKTKPELSLTDIAYQLNFSSSSNFTRMFKSQYGISPRKAKTNQELPVLEKDHLHKLSNNYLEGRDIPYEFDASRIQIKNIESFNTYYIRIYRNISLPRIAQVMYALGLRAMLSGVYDTSELVLALNETFLADGEASFDVCLHILDPDKTMLNLNQRKFEGGLYAVYKYYGNPYATLPAWQQFYLDWLPASGYDLDDRPTFQILNDLHFKHKFSDPINSYFHLPIKKI